MIRLHALVAGLLALAVATPASALNTRTWISGKGADNASCGPIATPCRTLQFAHDQTTAGGEIDVLDPAGYGSIVITKAINIINEGGVAGVLAGSGGTAILINAGSSDSVVLRGLSVEGSRVGANGIVFGSGGALTIANCVVQGFAGTGTSGNGIWIRHTTGSPNITITGTTASYNEYIGIVYSPTGSGGGRLSINGSVASHNGYGVSFYTTDAPTAAFTFAVSNSASLNNANFGFQFVASSFVTTYSATLSNSVSQNNGTDGVYVDGIIILNVSHLISSSNSVDFRCNNSAAAPYSDRTSFVRSYSSSCPNPQIVSPL